MSQADGEESHGEVPTECSSIHYQTNYNVHQNINFRKYGRKESPLRGHGRFKGPGYGYRGRGRKRRSRPDPPMDELKYKMELNNIFSTSFHETLTKNNIDADMLRNIKQIEIDDVGNKIDMEYAEKLRLRELWEILNKNDDTERKDNELVVTGEVIVELVVTGEKFIIKGLDFDKDTTMILKDKICDKTQIIKYVQEIRYNGQELDDGQDWQQPLEEYSSYASPVISESLYDLEYEPVTRINQKLSHYKIQNGSVLQLGLFHHFGFKIFLKTSIGIMTNVNNCCYRIDAGSEEWMKLNFWKKVNSDSSDMWEIDVERVKFDTEQDDEECGSLYQSYVTDQPLHIFVSAVCAKFNKLK